MGPKTERLIRQVTTRGAVVSAMGRFRLFLLILAGLYGALLLASRLLGVIPDYFEPLTLVTLAAAAAAMAVAFYRRPAPAEAAHRIDGQAGTKDLYLTAALIDTTAGEYQPLVLESAEGRAGAIRPRAVAPITWYRPFGHSALALGALLCGVLLLPQLDPFGREQERKEVTARREKLKTIRKMTTARAERLKREDVDAGHSAQVTAALEELKKTFRTMKKVDQQGNMKRLGENQKRVGDMWQKAKKTRQEMLKKALASMSTQAQRFGANASKLNQWRKQMKSGDPSGLKKEIEKLKEDAERLSKMAEGGEKRELAESIAQRLKDLSEFANNEMNSRQASGACQSAMDQLAMSGVPGLSSEALENLADSLELMDMEMSADAQSIRDLQAMEQAMQALRDAQQANQGESLEGSQASQCQGLADYADLYSKLAGQCAGGMGGKPGMNPQWQEGPTDSQGGGMGKRGRGEGGKAPEDDDSFTAFETKKSRANLQAGKILLQWKFRDVSAPGRTEGDYQRQLELIKQGVSEAIEQERIPPGYSEDIKRYFDTLTEIEEEANGE